MGSRSESIKAVQLLTLSQLEVAFADHLPSHSLFPKSDSGPNSRRCIYSHALTFHCMLWQRFHPDASGREVVRQLQTSFRLHNGPFIDDGDSAYCQAKARIPIEPFYRAVTETARRADQMARRVDLLQRRSLKLIDGTCLTLSDQPANRLAYPPVQCPKDTPSFPIMRSVLIGSLDSGAILSLAEGSQRDSELALSARMLPQLNANDVVIGDGGYGCYPFMASLQSRKVDFIGRCSRKIDARRRVSRRSSGDFVVQWTKGKKPSPWMTPEEWKALPETAWLKKNPWIDDHIRGGDAGLCPRGFGLTIGSLNPYRPETYPARATEMWVAGSAVSEAGRCSWDPLRGPTLEGAPPIEVARTGAGHSPVSLIIEAALEWLNAPLADEPADSQEEPNADTDFQGLLEDVRDEEYDFALFKSA
jgi:hypothetical protein